jgi:hypothetical protein
MMKMIEIFLIFLVLYIGTKVFIFFLDILIDLFKLLMPVLLWGIAVLIAMGFIAIYL